jgi:hypothetical protein
VTRTWTDANSNFRPDCNLQNPLVQDNRGAGGDFCAQISTLNFGKDVFTSDLDPSLRSGYGVRPGDGQWGVSVQQQLLPRVSIEFGYNRRWLNNFTVVDNALNLTSDYDPFQVTAPLDPRLPNGGGYVMSGLFNVNPSVASLTNNVTTKSENYGTQINSSHGILLNISARPRNGLIFQGGLSSGTTRTDSCEIRSLLPETAATDPWCNTSTGWTTRYTGLGSYTLPRIDLLL